MKIKTHVGEANVNVEITDGAFFVHVWGENVAVKSRKHSSLESQRFAIECATLDWMHSVCAASISNDYLNN
jgi:hypothetical protein